MGKSITVEEASFIKDFLTSTDFKRFCHVYFDYRRDVVQRLCEISCSSPSYGQDMAKQQGILVGMDKFAAILQDCENIIAKSIRKELKVVKDG